MDNQFVNTGLDGSGSRDAGVPDTSRGPVPPSLAQAAAPQPQPAPEAPPVQPSTAMPPPGNEPTRTTLTPVPESAIHRKPPVTTFLARLSPRTRRIGGVILLLLLIVGGAVAFIVSQRVTQQEAETPGNFVQSFNPLDVSLNEISTASTLSTSRTLGVNGQLQVNGSLIMTPGVRPAQPVIGQLYFDQTSNRFNYFDGNDFVQIQTSQDAAGVGVGGTTNNLTVVNAAAEDANNAKLNVAQTFSRANTFRNSTDSSAAFQVQRADGTNVFAVDTASNSVTVGAPNAPSSVTLGSTAGDSSTTLQSGTGNLSINTGSVTDTSGSISIKTGDSSTTASGNITIDAGSGIISGEVVGTKDFESGLDNLVNWFGSSLSQTTAQAHSGTHSLQMTATAAFWGIQENINNPITPVIAGHQYHFSIWVRAATTPRSITSRMVWTGVSGGGGIVNLQTVTDSTTGWTEITGTAVAPGGATGVYPTMQGTGVVGEVHYFDNIVITDLSSSAAASTINIGDTNAKIITIGNLNQIGATSIRGGSGINLQSGAGPLSMSGGAITMTGTATSSLSTTLGALSVTSAASATWGVTTAPSGLGGTLTLKAGNGGTDANNDGGDLILQGGRANGAAADGAVIVKPVADSAEIFQIQNSAGTPILSADSANRTITITGTDSAFSKFSLSNAHFSSTQTTAPTISTPANCGTTPTAVVTPGSTDSAGSFTLTAGSGAVAGPCAVTITFRSPYAAAPKSVIVVPTTAVGTAPQGKAALVSATAAGSFTTTITPANPASSEVNAYYYWVIE